MKFGTEPQMQTRQRRPQLDSQDVNDPTRPNDHTTVDVHIDDDKPGSVSIQIEATAASTAAEPTFKCSICQTKFAFKTDLTSHIPSHFRVIECSICGESITGDIRYNYHMQNVHNERPPTATTTTNDDDNDDDDAAPPKPFTRCRHCNHKCPAEDMMEHMQCEHPNRVKRFKCLYCNERFQTFNQRSVHQHAEHPDECASAMACDVCGRICRSRAAVKLHRKTHTNDKEFVCDMCDKSFNRRLNLENHLRTHTGERPHACDLCPKRFTHISGLNIHVRAVHTKERPYRCPFCEKSYIHSTDLRRHRRTHGGEEKRFECELCRKQFYERKFLTSHMKRHARVQIINIEMEVVREDGDEVKVEQEDVKAEDGEGDAFVEEFLGMMD